MKGDQIRLETVPKLQLLEKASAGVRDCVGATSSQKLVTVLEIKKIDGMPLFAKGKSGEGPAGACTAHLN